MGVTERSQVYRCNVCGNIVEVLHAGKGILVCCNQNMELLKENTQEGALEKHIPVIEKTEKGIIVKVGELEHPMTEDHYIEFIEIHLKNGRVGRAYLNPRDKPEAEFPVKFEDVAFAREYCNLHGLWLGKP